MATFADLEYHVIMKKTKTRPFTEIARERCRQEVQRMGIPLSQFRIERRGKQMNIAAYLGPGNAVDFMCDDERAKTELIAYLIEQGVVVEEAPE